MTVFKQSQRARTSRGERAHEREREQAVLRGLGASEIHFCQRAHVRLKLLAHHCIPAKPAPREPFLTTLNNIEQRNTRTLTRKRDPGGGGGGEGGGGRRVAAAAVAAVSPTQHSVCTWGAAVHHMGMQPLLRSATTHLAFDYTTDFCWREQTAAAAATATTTAGAAATTTAGATATTTAGAAATMIAGAVSQHPSLITPLPSWHAPHILRRICMRSCSALCPGHSTVSDPCLELQMHCL